MIGKETTLTDVGRRVNVATSVKPSNKRARSVEMDGTVGEFDPAVIPRRRAAVACEACRFRKTRCDIARPSCGFCSKARIPCVYRSSPARNNARQNKTSETSSQSPDILKLLEFRRATSNRDPASIPTQERTPGTATSTIYTFSGDITPCLTGITLQGLTLMSGLPCAPELQPLLWEDAEAYLEQESQNYNLFFNFKDLQPTIGLDLSLKACWKHQQSFARNVLVWYPVFDPSRSVDIMQTCFENKFDPDDIMTIIALFILALGALTGSDDPSEARIHAGTPGLAYFHKASRLLALQHCSSLNIIRAQCYILQGCFLLLCLRNLSAFDVIHEASVMVTRLLALKSRLENDSMLRQSCLRAYWVCYIIEHELCPHVSYATRLLEPYHDYLQLPWSERYEPGFFWFLSEIALRRIYVNGLCGSGREDKITYAPVVAEELTTQLERWHELLHPSVKFPLGTEPLLDQQKAHLRVQFFAAQFQVNWTYVVCMLTKPPEYGSHEHNVMLSAAQRAIKYGVMHLTSLEPLLHDRNPVLYANVTGAYAIGSMLMCVIKLPKFLELHDLESTMKIINRAVDMLNVWAEGYSNVRFYVDKMEEIMKIKGLDVL